VPQALTMAQFAQRWILDHEEVSVIIPGATSTDQARANASISDLPPLSQPLHERLANYYQAKVHPLIRGPY
jgi:aryl-alcohol dehydrogenase-like predicted oxidoreductase